MNILSIIRQPDGVFAETEDKRLTLTAQSGSFAADGVEVVCREADGTLQIAVSAQPRLRFVTLRWQLPFPESVQLLGDALERSYGDLQWQGLVPERAMPWYFLLTDGAATAGIGVKTNPHALCWWQADSDGVSLLLDVRTGGRGVCLNGRTLPAATVVFMPPVTEPAFTAAQRFCRLMCDNGVFPDAPVYGSNNWYYAYGDSSHEQILRDAALAASLAPSEGVRPFMVIDDGWQSDHEKDYNGGPWILGNARFPDMARLAADIADRGAIPGLWFRPLQNHAPDIPDSWRQKHDPTLLDPSLPEVRNYIAEDIRRFSAWGYRLIKHDFSTFDLIGTWGNGFLPKQDIGTFELADNTLTNAEVLMELYRAIYAARGEGVLILGCNCIGHLGTGMMHLFRTGDDTSGLDWERTRKMGVNTLAFRLPQHRVFFDVDADCIGVTPHIDWEKNRQWLHLLQNSGTPLFVSADPDTLTDEQKAALRAAFWQAAKQTDVAVPLDWQSTCCPARWSFNGKETRYHWFAGTDSLFGG